MKDKKTLEYNSIIENITEQWKWVFLPSESMIRVSLIYIYLRNLVKFVCIAGMY